MPGKKVYTEPRLNIGGMTLPKLLPYSRKLEYSYALGIFPCMNLLEAHPERVTRLLLSPEGEESEGVNRLREKCRALGIREEYAERVLRRESQKDNCFAGLVFEKYESDLSRDAPHVVLCQISDGGNLGTALRSCLGFGIRDVAVVRPCVDVFDPHVLRSSMGAFYRMRVTTLDSFDQYRAAFPGRPLFPFMLDRRAKPLPEAVKGLPENAYSLVFGNEASGLPPAFADYGQSVIIPQSDEIDSLNLSVAVSIGVYSFTQAHKQERKGEVRK